MTRDKADSNTIVDLSFASLNDWMQKILTLGQLLLKISLRR